MHGKYGVWMLYGAQKGNNKNTNCITCSKSGSACFYFGGAGRRTGTKVGHCTAFYEASSIKTYFSHLEKDPPKS